MLHCIYLMSIFLVAVVFGLANTLKAEFTTAKLPKPMLYTQPIYDGNNSIYLFGGVEWADIYRDILRYDIVSDSIELLGQLPSAAGVKASVQWFEDNIYYFGANTGVLYNGVVKFDPRTNEVTNFGTLPGSLKYPFLTTFKQQNSSIVHIFLPQLESYEVAGLYQFDLKTKETAIQTINFRGYSSVVRDNSAFIFGDLNRVLRIRMDSYDEPLVINTPEFSDLNFPSSDGINAYLIGGKDRGSPGGNYLLQFNLETYDWDTIEVQDFPYKGDIGYSVAPSSIFIEKFNRIYYFGGLTVNETSRQNVYRNDIWYIDLSAPVTEAPTTPRPIFTCDGKPNGMYPHKQDCSKFVWCNDGVSTDLRCPAPLLFDPLIGRCDHPDEVSCEAGCTGKPNGQYPHPRKCESFILCRDEVLKVYQCPAPLLFDPVFFICNDPNLVNCSTECFN